MLIDCILLMQEEKEVLALLSKLDLDNIHFAGSPPGMFTLNHISFGPRANNCFAYSFH